jgi:Membrane-associated lipoprotein involved in thiamine biosynthesis
MGKKTILGICMAVICTATLYVTIGAKQFSQRSSSPPTVTPTAEVETDLTTLKAQIKQTGAYFGTISMLRALDNFSNPEAQVRLDRTWTAIKQRLEEVEQAISTTVETSDIARFNAIEYGQSIPISHYTADILKEIQAVYEQTDGYFDPTVCLLVDLWGFSPRFHSAQYAPAAPYDRPRGETGFALPEQHYIDGFLNLVDFGGILLEGDEEIGYSLKKMIPPVTIDGITYQAQLDLGGIGKGYAADQARKIMIENGYTFGYFTCGGSSMSLLQGLNEKSLETGEALFELGMRKPRTGQNDSTEYLHLKIAQADLSTSGDYDQAYQVDGIVYSHLINPKTGYPVNMPVNGKQGGIATVTVLGDNATYCEGLSTALCVMGFTKALALMNTELKNHQVAMVLYLQGEKPYEVVTNMAAENYHIADDAYSLASEINPAQQVKYTGVLMHLQN